MYIYLYVGLYMFVCIYTDMYICIHMFIFVYMNGLYIYGYMYTYVCVGMYAYTCAWEWNGDVGVGTHDRFLVSATPEKQRMHASCLSGLVTHDCIQESVRLLVSVRGLGFDRGWLLSAVVGSVVLSVALELPTTLRAPVEWEHSDKLCLPLRWSQVVEWCRITDLFRKLQAIWLRNYSDYRIRDN